MRTFDVYNHPAHGYQAVKQGFCWPAFFFVAIWAFVKRMWTMAIGLLSILVILHFAERRFEQEGNDIGVLLMLFLQIAVYVIAGLKGNDWRRANLSDRGFRHVATLEAENPEASVSKVISQENSQEGTVSTNSEYR